MHKLVFVVIVIHQFSVQDVIICSRYYRSQSTTDNDYTLIYAAEQSEVRIEIINYTTINCIERKLPFSCTAQY